MKFLSALVGAFAVLVLAECAPPLNPPCKTPAYPVCVAALKSTGLDYVKDKIACGTSFTRDCLGVPQGKINACKSGTDKCLVAGTSIADAEACVTKEFPTFIRCTQCTTPTYPVCVAALTSTGLDYVKDEIECGASFTRDCLGVPQERITTCKRGTDKCLVAGTPVAEAENCVRKEFPTYMKCTQCTTPIYPVCVASLISIGLDYVKDKIKCGASFTRDCLGVPQARIDACKSGTEKCVVDGTPLQTASLCVIKEFPKYSKCVQCTSPLYPECVMNLKSTGMDLLKDKIKCGTDFVKNCQGISDAVINACLAKSQTSDCLKRTDLKDAEACVNTNFKKFRDCI